MMKQLIAAGTILMASHMALAGAANAEITCKSGSGRTLINASFPVDNPEQSLSVTVDGKTQIYIDQNMKELLEMNNRNPEEIFPGHRVVEISSNRDKNSISMVALTVTNQKFDDIHLVLRSTGPLKKISSGSHSEKLQFKAEVSGADPRTNLQSTLPEGIIVNCVYDYSI